MLSLINLLVIAIVICAVLGIFYIIIRQCGIQIPDWVIQIFWIVVAAVIGIMAVKLVAGML